MSATAFTINAGQRKVLFRLACERLARADVIYLALAHGRPAEAEEGAIELAQDLDLLHHIGWDAEDAREIFELSLAPSDLLEVLERYAEEAERSIFQVGTAYGFDNASAASVAHSARICRGLISSLDSEEDSRAFGVTAEERDDLHWLLTASLFRRDASAESVETLMQDLRLLIGLGWLDRDQMEALGWPEGSLETFPLVLPEDEMLSALRRLSQLAREGIEAERSEQPTPGLKQRRARFARAARLCEGLIDQMENATKGGA